MYEMPLRAYDPAIARWNRIDPVIHHSLSTYNAFDNNPVFYADPSGGNSEWGVSGGRHFGGFDGSTGSSIFWGSGDSFQNSGLDIDDVPINYGSNIEGGLAAAGFKPDNNSSSKKQKWEAIAGDGEFIFPQDDITVNSDGIITNIVRNESPNRFFDGDGNEIFLNDPEGVDRPTFLAGDYVIGDRLFYNINTKQFNKFLTKGGLDPLIHNVLSQTSLSNDNVYQKIKAYWYARLNSLAGGKADFSWSVLAKNFDFNQEKSYGSYTGYVETNAYFRFGSQSTIYNWFDAGNFMWGGWMNFSQFSYGEAKFGSQYNEAFDDAPADQRAIKNGFNFINK